MVTVAMLTGVHLHGSPGGRHSTVGHWQGRDRADRAERSGLAEPGERAERIDRTERVELGDTRIPVRTVRRSYVARDRSRHLQLEARERSPEVIVGYVNPTRGSTAFHRLTNVVEGDRVKVVRRDHSVDWFKVDSIRRAVRRSIAEERTRSGRPELRLISWRGERSPRDVVVSAHLDRPEPVDD